MAILVVAALSMIGATAITSFKIPTAYADANCDQANFEDNPSGNTRGNAKQCGGPFSEGPKEPIRDCLHKNEFKDNDGDGFSECKFRGKFG
jgi:hypothetical protein